ncbi:hypothetical protein CPB83DRAFT_848337 [Crepidotus variabilis]|uniref:DUF4246 domain-containing protein n=1 Tax=Crepidotus variabilis TaxID=179855 RepID=A0A9P6JT91_9AGAR|nr:hypothetical protein CPB83DRAFT_848337 [Crepidotus variabilis]
MSSKDQNMGYRHPFLFGIHYLGGVGDAPRTLVDLAMSQLSAEIRRSDNWWQARLLKDFRSHWTDEGLARIWRVKTPSSVVDVKLSTRQVDYVLDELDGYATLRDEHTRCQVSVFDRIWQAETLLDNEKTSALIQGITHLRLSTKSDSEDVTVNLIDPTLHSLVFNRSLVSQLNGRRFRPVPPPPKTDIYTLSSRFQLLPTDIFIRIDGTTKFLSYINNLHPQHHRTTYDLLQQLFDGFVPLFENALTDLHRNNPMYHRIPGPSRYTVWNEPEAPEHSDDDEGWIEYEREMREWALKRPINLPDVQTSGYSGNLHKRRHIVKLRNRVVQVITRVMDIRLTPDRPAFEGNKWHVEGMRGERIVACGFHCLSMDNISNPKLDFRMAVSYPRGFSAGDNGATMRTWGMRDGDSCHQYIGQVPTHEGLSLVFPNIYQHRQSGFKLDDPTKDGYLTAIWFLFVDPDIQPTISTSLVAPQQRGWIHEALDIHLDKRLPNEVLEAISDHTEGLMTRQEAFDYRDILLRELDSFTAASNSYHFCIPFDIWNGPELVP